MNLTRVMLMTDHIIVGILKSQQNFPMVNAYLTTIYNALREAEITLILQEEAYQTITASGEISAKKADHRVK